MPRFASIRHWETDSSSVPEILRRTRNEFVPLLTKIDGFESYDIVDTGKGQLVSISVFRTETGAVQSDQVAVDWAKSLNDLAPKLSHALSGVVVLHQNQT
jgi:hypothetical protein